MNTTLSEESLRKHVTATERYRPDAIIADQTVDDVRNKAVTLLSLLIELPPDDLVDEFSMNPNTTEIQFMLEQGATLENLLGAAQSVEDTSVFFPTPTKNEASGNSLARVRRGRIRGR